MFFFCFFFEMRFFVTTQKEFWITQREKKYVYCDECDDDVESAHANDGDDVFFENNFQLEISEDEEDEQKLPRGVLEKW